MSRHDDRRAETAACEPDPIPQTATDPPQRATNRASGPQIVLGTLAVVAVVTMLFYGLNHERTEQPTGEQTNATSAPAAGAATTGQNAGTR